VLHWRRYARFALCGRLACLAGCALPPGNGDGGKSVRIIVDTSRRYQTFQGWGGEIPNLHWNGGDPPQHSGPTSPVPPDLAREAMDLLVNDLGITRFDHNIHPALVEKDNDNNDPFHTDSAGFDFSAIDPYVHEFFLPLQERVRQRGEPFLFSIKLMTGGRGVGPGGAIHRRNPQEYAEFCVAMLRHFRQQGLEAQFLVLENEPDLHPGWTPAMLGTAIATVGRRLRAAGLATKIAAPESMSPGAAPAWLGGISAVREAVPYLGLITFHSYDHASTAGERPPIGPRVSLAQWARKLNLPAAQTEESVWGRANTQAWSPQRYQKSLDLAQLVLADLNYANVSQWQLYQAFSVNFTTREETESDAGFVMLKGDYSGLYRPRYTWALRQFTRNIRPGAVRVSATVLPEQSVQATAFLSPQRKLVIVALNRGAAPAQLSLAGLPPGEYQVSRSSMSENGAELPALHLAPGQTHGPLLPPESITTIIQR
jgi:hypothetical protein